MSTASYLYSSCQLAQLALIYTESTQPKKIKTVHRSTLLFTGLSSAFLLWNTFRPTAGITQKQSWLLLAASGAGAGIAYRNSRLADEINLDELGLSGETQKTVRASYRTPQSQRLPQALLVAQLIHALGSLFFGEAQKILLAPLAASAAALFLSQRLRLLEVNYKHDKEIQFEVERSPNLLGPHHMGHIPTYHGTITPELVYRTFTPVQGAVQPTEGECRVCQKPSDFSICSQSHPICKPCFLAHCITSIDRLGHKDNLFTVNLHFNSLGDPSWALFNHFTYEIELDKEDPPTCPTCRGESVLHSLPEFKIQFKQGTIKLKDDAPEAVPDPGFWSGVFCGFTAVQLTLACAQYTHPHLAGTLYNIQKLMLPLDLMFLSGLAIAEQKRTTTEPYVRPEWAAKAAAAASALLAVGLILYRWKSTPPSLIHHLKGIISDDALANIKMTNLPPISLRLMQWSYGTRVFALLALASLSPNKKTHIAAAALSALTLLKLSTISWVCIERTYTDLHWAADLVTTQLHFMIPNLNKVGSTTEQFQQTLKSLTDYSARFFEKGSWDCHWLNNYYNGVYMGRDLVFEAVASPGPLSINGHDFFDLLMSWEGSVRSDEWYRTILELEIAGKSTWAPLF